MKSITSSIVWCIVILIHLLALSSCAMFQNMDKEKVNACAEECTLTYIKSIDAIVDKDIIMQAGIEFSNCMIQCTDATDYVFSYINDKVNGRNVQLK
jgi:hypothetical protein